LNPWWAYLLTAVVLGVFVYGAWMATVGMDETDARDRERQRQENLRRITERLKP
jgi:predicted DNA repair protein MutK